MTEKKVSTQKMGLLILFAEALIYLGTGVAIGYGNFLLTDVANVSVAVAATIISVGSIASFLFTILSGALITNTRSRMGQYRPWFLWGGVAACVGALLMMFNYGSIWLTVVVVGVSYCAYLLGGLVMNTGKFGIYAKLAGSDNDARNLLNSRSFAGLSIGSVVVALGVLPMVVLFGGESMEANGWRLAQGIFALLSLIGIFIIVKAGKKVDPSNLLNEKGEKEDRIKFRDMLKAVWGNRPALAIFFADCFKNTGMTFLNFIMVYQLAYVIGDIKYMTIALMGCSVACIVGAIFTPYVVKLFGGRKKTAMIVTALTGLIFLSIAFTGKTAMGFLIPFIAGWFITSFIDPLAILFYIDAGEYWLAEKGVDNKPFLMSIQNLTFTVGMIVGSVVVGVVLTASGYQTDIMLTGSNATTMTLCTGIITAVGYIMYTVVLLLFHNVSDKKMEEYIKKNVEAGLSVVEE